MACLPSRITKRVVDAAEPAAKDYVLWDDEIPGFGLRVSMRMVASPKGFMPIL